MKKISFFCDRCGKEIKEDVYELTIYATPVTVLIGQDFRETMASACENIRQNTIAPISLCKSCRDGLGNYLNEKTEGHKP